PSYWDDPLLRVFNLWGYVDVQDVAQACRRAVQADLTGAPSYVIAAADSLMDRPSAELAAAVFPEVPVRGELAHHDTLLSTVRAREQLGYVPQYSWRDVLGSS